MTIRANYLFLFIFLNPVAARPADSLGRLFLTPDHRAQLETVRAQRDLRLPVVVDTKVAPAPTQVPARRGPDVITYNGVVRRSDGKLTIWLNGKPVNDSRKGKKTHEISMLGLGHDGAVLVAIPQATRTESLKVGQRLYVISGRVKESNLRRAAVPQPPVEPAQPYRTTSNALKAPEDLATPTTSAGNSTRPNTNESNFKIGEAPPPALNVR